MELHRLYLTHSDCYERNRTKADNRYIRFQERGPLGVMIHSIGANNPNLRRYLGPDDGVIGENDYGNHWNNPGLDACVHGFVGKDKTGEVKAYQTLPWNFRGWHCGRSGNDTHVSIEICEDGLGDSAYLSRCCDLAAEMTAEICREYGLDPMKKGVVIDHAEGHAMGIASNHGDITHWMKKYGKSMDDFRRLVAEKMKEPEKAPEKKPEKKPGIYPGLDDVPQWGRETVEKLVQAGVILGDGENLNLSYDLVRTLVILDRLGKL